MTILRQCLFVNFVKNTESKNTESMFRFLKQNSTILFFVLLQIFALQQINAQVIYSNGFEGATIAGTTSFTGGATGDPNLNIAASTWSTSGVYTTFTGTAPTTPTSMALQPGTATTTTWTLTIPVNASYEANITSLQFDYRSTSTSYNTLSITINGTLVYFNNALNTASTWVTVPVTGLSITGITGSISMVCVMSGGAHGGASTFRFDNVSLSGTVDNANNPPSFAGGVAQSLTICENSPATSINSLMAINDLDVGQTETWTILSTPGNGTLGGFSTTALSTGGTVTPTGLTYTPNPGFSGTDGFKIQISDGIATSFTVVNVTVNPLPSAISGTTNICVGATTSLTDATLGGTWISGNTVVANIGSISGTVTANTVGTSTITYTASLGCSITTMLTVNALPEVINGTLSICVGNVTSLTDATTGGTWSSSNTAVGTVDASGNVSGITAGTTIISYITPSNCYITTVVTVNTTPTAILGTLNICQGSTTSLSDAITGGIWSSSNMLVGTIDVTGIAIGITSGTTTITYTLSGNCYATGILTVNTLPTAINGVANVCAGSTTSLSDGIVSGTWSSSNTAVGTINTTGVVSGISSGTTTITYTMPGNCYVTTDITVNITPSAIIGTLSVCQGSTTSLSDFITGGTWSSSNAGVGSVNVTGIASGVGAGTTTITYAMPGNCYITGTLTVNASPSAINGLMNVCVGLTTLLTDGITGGAWSSSNTAVGTINTTGTLTGIAAGTTTITYTMPGNCYITTVVTVNPLPSGINGTLTVCQGLTTALTNTVSGGIWSSSNIAVGSVNAVTGIVTGISGGTTIITYTTTNCTPVTAVVTVNPVSPISGALTVCGGLSTQFSDAITGGTWTSTNTGIASVGFSSGIVTGFTPGTATIIYTFTSGCTTSTIITVNASPVAISGSLGLCIGNSITFSDISSGGTWSSSNTAVGTIVATSGTFSALTTGTTTITYSVAAGCNATATVTVNPLPSLISGIMNVCTGLSTILTDATTGGAWLSSNAGIAVVGSSSGNVSGITQGTAIISYILPTGCYSTGLFTINSLPAAISGTAYLCQALSTSFTDVTGGGTWSSSNGNASVGSLSGFVSGINPGVTFITYTLPTTCFITYPVTITATPLPVSGPSNVCMSSAIVLSDDVAPGTWNVIPSTGNASIDASGILTGLIPGQVLVSYTTLGCNPVIHPVTVNPLPSAIMGNGNLCLGSGTSLSDATLGGAWSSSNVMVSVSSTGIVSGVDTGAGTIISYTLPTGCYTTVPVIVFPLPAPISGVDSICPGDSLILSDVTPGGVWSSSDGTIAHSIAVNGIVEGLSPGSVTISYTLISGCYATMPFRVENALPASLSITQTPDTLLCSGTPVTLTANSVNGGTPTYEWFRFGSHFAYGDTLSYTPTHSDYITCVMTTHNICASPAVIQDSIVMNVYPDVTPIVAISTLATNDTAAYLGNVFTFFTTLTNGGVDPAYQWYINSAPVPGATSSTFTTHVYNDNDTVYCIVTITTPCNANSTSKSPSYTIYGLGFLSVNPLSIGNSNLSLFPNPNTGSFTLSGQLSTTSGKDVLVEIADMLGRTVYTSHSTPQQGKIDCEIKLPDEVIAGAYLLRVSTEIGVETVHFVIAK